MSTWSAAVSTAAYRCSSNPWGSAAVSKGHLHRTRKHTDRPPARMALITSDWQRIALSHHKKWPGSPRIGCAVRAPVTKTARFTPGWQHLVRLQLYENGEEYFSHSLCSNCRLPSMAMALFTRVGAPSCGCSSTRTARSTPGTGSRTCATGRARCEHLFEHVFNGSRGRALVVGADTERR